MTNSVLQSYVTVLRKSNLVLESDLKQTLLRLKKDRDFSDLSVEHLSETLIESGLITPWQHRRLLQGKTGGFYLGNYRLLGELGEGGMSRVFMAEHEKMKRRCAIKVLPETTQAPQEDVARFEREARAMAQLNHPNLIRAYDYDRKRNLHYLVMEAVDGQDLEKRVAAEGPLSIQQAAHYIEQAADGLAYAHSHRIIHRDIKPSNLLVTLTDDVKILDLGIALLTGKTVGALTRKLNEEVVGTADYMSPEQAFDTHEVDRRSDIYSLGCTFFFLLTGRAPFSSRTIAETLLRHQTAKVPNLFEFREDVPEDLVEFMEWMMRKDPDDRPQSMEEVRDWLHRWGRAVDGALPHGRSGEDTLATESTLVEIDLGDGHAGGESSLRDEATFDFGQSGVQSVATRRSGEAQPRPNQDMLGRAALLLLSTVGFLALVGLVIYYAVSEPVASNDKTEPADDQRPAFTASAKDWTAAPNPPSRRPSPRRAKKPDLNLTLLIEQGETWQYLAGGNDPPANWAEVNFDASEWKTGQAGFGYGDGDDRTTFSDMRHNYLRAYIRKTFDPGDVPQGKAFLVINYDDGFIAYLNGTEIARSSVGSGRGPDAKDVTSHEARRFEKFPIENFRELLRDGENVLAIEGHNRNLTSSDLTLDPYLGVKPAE